MIYQDKLNFLEEDTDLDHLDDDELLALDDDLAADEDLDTLAVLDANPEPPKPDPEAMLPLLSHADPAQRILAARAFCEIQDDRAIAPLIELLADPCPLVRVAAAYALGRNPSPDAVMPSIDRLDRDWNGYVRKGLVWALGNYRDIRTLEPLQKALKTDIAAVRLWAASALGQAADLGYAATLATVPPIIEALVSDPLAAVRSNCAWSLGRLCRELPSNVVYATAVDALIQVLEEDADAGVRDDAKSALLKLGDPRGVRAIENIAEATDDLEL